MSDRLLRTPLSTGRGSHYAACHGCHRSSPATDTADDLRILALARAASWRCDRQADGRYILVCPGCRVTRRPNPVVLGP